MSIDNEFIGFIGVDEAEAKAEAMAVVARIDAAMGWPNAHTTTYATEDDLIVDVQGNTYRVYLRVKPAIRHLLTPAELGRGINYGKLLSEHRFRRFKPDGTELIPPVRTRLVSHVSRNKKKYISGAIGAAITAAAAGAYFLL